MKNTAKNGHICMRMFFLNLGRADAAFASVVQLTGFVHGYQIAMHRGTGNTRPGSNLKHNRCLSETAIILMDIIKYKPFLGIIFLTYISFSLVRNLFALKI